MPATTEPALWDHRREAAARRRPNTTTKSSPSAATREQPAQGNTDPPGPKIKYIKIILKNCLCHNPSTQSTVIVCTYYLLCWVQLKCDRRTISFLFFWGGGGPWCEACGILVPQPGTGSTRPAVEAHSLNPCTARQVPGIFY